MSTFFAFSPIITTKLASVNSSPLLSDWPMLNRVLFEDQALTLSSFEEYKSREVPYKAKLVPIRGDKGTRFSALAIRAQRGDFYINPGIPKLPVLQPEFLTFPRGDHDDTVDACSLPLALWGANEIRAGTVQISIPTAPSDTRLNNFNQLPQLRRII